MKIERITKQVKNVFKNHFFRCEDQINYIEARKLISKDPLAILLDVRSKQEYNEYHLDGAICIPTYELAQEISNIVVKRDQLIICYCQSGARSRKAIKILRQMGYQNLYEIKGGIDNI